MTKENGSVQDIVDRLLRQIYLKELKPEEKLPPFRAHAEELGVDPTSLRAALKQLEIMNLLEIRRSDGTYVKSYAGHAGLDFLSRIFAIGTAESGSTVVDDFLVDEAMAFWNMVFPEIMYEGSRNMSAMDVKTFIETIERQMEDVDNVETLVDLDVDLQDSVAGRANNIVVTLLFNSLRPLRIRLTDFFYRNLDRDSRLHFLSMKKKGLCRQLSGDLDLKWSAEEHRKALEAYRLSIRQNVMKKMIGNGLKP
jgi:DNA-binding FadR family transcriptional regulator